MNLYFRVQARILYLLMIESMLVIAVFKPVPLFIRTFLLSAFLILKGYHLISGLIKKDGYTRQVVKKLLIVGHRMERDASPARITAKLQ
jgi:hypothetical protein